MAQSSVYKAELNSRMVHSARKFDWAEVRNVMLTDNSAFDSEDPSACMDTFVSCWQIEDVQRCIKTLYQGLRFANLLKIKGGYAGQRDYNGIFLIDDNNLVGVFDDRNSLNNGAEEKQLHPKTTEDLIQFYRHGRGNIKTLVAFEKPNLRLVNSDERGCQSYFVMETVYPALAAIVKILSYLEDLEDKEHNKSLKVWSGRHLVKSLEDRSQSFLFSPKCFLSLFKCPSQANKFFLHTSPLQFFCHANSPFNLDISSDCFERLQSLLVRKAHLMRLEMGE